MNKCTVSYDEQRDLVYRHSSPERRKCMDENRQIYLEAARPLLDELAAIGLPVESIGELYQRPLPYRHAIPLLIDWLSRIKQEHATEDIVRALSVKWARPVAAPALIGEFHRTDGFPHLKWAIGNALSVVADDSVYDDIVQIVQDRSHGKARQMVAVAMGNMRNPAAVDVLIGLLDDEIAGHALIALRKLGAVRARPFVEPFLTHPRTWWRNEAKKAIAKFDKLEEKLKAPPDTS